MIRGGKIATVLVLAVMASACGWTQARFDAGRTANNTFEQSITAANVGTLVPGWSVTGSQYVGEPVISGGRVVAQDRTGVHVFDAVTGAPRWSAPSPGSSATISLLFGVAIARTTNGPDIVLSAIGLAGAVLHPQGSGGELTAYDATSGALMWSQPIGPHSAPLVVDQTVFMISHVNGFGGPTFSGLVALDLTTGTIKFRTPLSSIAASLAAAGPFVMVAIDPGFAAIPAAGCGTATCPIAWSGTSSSSASNALAAANGSIFVATDEGLEAYAAAGCGALTCPPTWRTADSTGGLAIGPGFVFATPKTNGDFGLLRAYSASGCGAATCTPVWTSTDYKAYSVPSIANGVLYAGALDGALRAYAASGCGVATCSPIWSKTLPDPVVSPMVAVGRLYVPSLTLRTYQLPSP